MARFCLSVVLLAALACDTQTDRDACALANDQSEWEQAIELCRSVWRNDEDPSAGFRWARAAARLGDVSIAREVLKAVDERSVIAARLLYIVAVDDDTRGESDKAQMRLIEALSIFEEHHDWKRATAVTQRIGAIRFRDGHYVDAAAILEAGWALAQQANDTRSTYEVSLRIAAVHREVGNGALADHWESRALAMFPNDPTSIAVQGDAAQRRGRFAVAEALYERASPRLAEHQDWGTQRVLAFKLVELALLREDAEAAALHLAQANAAREKLTGGASLDELGPNVRSSTLFYRASVALAAGNPDAASAAIAAARAGSLGADWEWQFVLLEGKVQHSQGQLDAAMTSWFAALDTAVPSGVSGAFDGQHANRRRREAVELASTAALELGDIDSSLAVIDRLNNAQAPASPLTAEVANEALHGQGALAYVVTADALNIVGVSNGTWFQDTVSIDRDELQALASAFVADPNSNAAADLSSLLLPTSFVEAEDPGMLVVVPDGPLQDIPWPALQTGRGLLVERVDILLAPSLRPPAHSLPLDAAARSVFVTDPGGDLPHARLEGRRWSEHLGGVHHTGLQATSTRVGGAKTDLLHLAVHSGISGGDAWIQLADKRMNAREIASLGPTASTVVLATCASTTARNGDIWTSVPGAFIRGGSNLVVGTLWSVKDDAAQRFVDALYGLDDGSIGPGAVSRAQRELLAQGHPPQQWASFASMGLPQPTAKATP